MADYITKIRTIDGDKQIDYNALANLPDLDQKANITYVDEKFSEISEFDPTEIQNAIDANTEAVASHTDSFAIHVPSCTTADDGKFLRVVDGVAVWTTINTAEGTGF